MTKLIKQDKKKKCNCSDCKERYYEVMEAKRKFDLIEHLETHEYQI